MVERMVLPSLNKPKHLGWLTSENVPFDAKKLLGSVAYPPPEKQTAAPEANRHGGAEKTSFRDLFLPISRLLANSSSVLAKSAARRSHPSAISERDCLRTGSLVWAAEIHALLGILPTFIGVNHDETSHADYTVINAPGLCARSKACSIPSIWRLSTGFMKRLGVCSGGAATARPRDE